jgi:soluble lytic murein transglycosylase-like protein
LPGKARNLLHGQVSGSEENAMSSAQRWAFCLATLLGLSAHALPREPAWPPLLAASAAEQTEWATRYEHGEGVTRNVDRAVRLYCAAARKGHTAAQYQLGWIYANGRGVRRDEGLAAAWFRLAAAGGDRYARDMLARLDDRGGKTPARCVGTEQVAPLPLSAGLQGPEREAVEQEVQRLAPRYDLDPALVLAVIQVESGFNPRARSPKGAQGLMQLMPDTAQRFGVRDPYDPVQNLHGGMSYLRWLLALFEGDVALALAGYNAGEQAVARHAGIPPYPETQDYVVKVSRVYPRAQHPVPAGTGRSRQS